VAERLGSLLVKAELITQEQLDEALKAQDTVGGRLGSSLVKMGFISADRLADFLSRQYHVPVVDLSPDAIEESVVKLIPAEVAQRYEVVPVNRVGRTLTLAMGNPTDLFAIEDIKFLTGLEVQAVVATETAIQEVLNAHYSVGKELAPVVEREDMTGEDIEVLEAGEMTEAEEEDVSELIALGQETPVIKLVNFLITDGVRSGASDIHIEPYEKILRVRFRVDGVLHEVMSPPHRLRAPLTSRIKIMSNLDIAERRVPQDGRIRIRVDEKLIDLRVSVIPTLYGEKVVMRILDKSGLMLDMTDLGFEEDALKNFLKAIESPYGIVLVTGPTGSGKTTTLYSALSRLNSPDKHILTVEDPIEYNLRGINQVQVNEEIGLTFAGVLRSFLRQAPNIIMVGEIRDAETAEIAIRAALTGHLVLSTIHTNDAPSTVNRLVDMGIDAFLVAASLNLIQAQRLVRRICPNCKQEIRVEPKLLEDLGIPREEHAQVRIYKGKGCSECGNKGYRGRIGLYEVLPISPTIRNMILERKSTAVITQKAREEGMRTLREDALMKLKAGITTVEEVLRETAAF
jgi:type IV pilus assembly protein PilB